MDSRETAPRLYPGISEEQSLRAHNALRAFYNGNFKKTERLLREMDVLEDRDSLPPLSRLLQVATAGLYVQRDDAGSAAEEARLGSLMDSAAQKAREKQRARGKGTDRETYLLIQGGIEGFRAILKLDKHSPVQVLSEGLGALKLLEQALRADSSIQDANLGVGIFHCTAANNSPRVVRSMLSALGRRIDLQDGLAALRKSGYEGQYTSVASQLYLIQFLTPYDDELRREKIEIFRSLQQTFPLSPYYLFLRWEEALSFYPDSFYNSPRLRVTLERRMRAVEARDYAAARYLNLIKYQYTLLNPNPGASYAPDTTFDLGGYAFYPGFIEVLRRRREITLMDAADPAREKRLKELKALKKQVLTRLQKPDGSGTPGLPGLSKANRRLYEWHIRDALRPEMLLPATGGARDTRAE